MGLSRDGGHGSPGEKPQGSPYSALNELPSSDGCFVCGQSNPGGLHIRFFTDGNVAFCQYKPSEQYQGYDGVLHGGLISTLLDEVMVKALAGRGIPVVTGKLEVRFRRPATTNERLTAKGWVLTQKARSYKAAGEITGEDGRILAEAEGVFFPAKLG